MKRARLILIIIAIVSLLVGIAIFILTGGNKHNVLPLISLGEKYLGEEEYEEAVLSFSRAINIEPKTARAYYGRARALLGQGNDEQSIEDLLYVAQLAPDKRNKIDWMIDKIGRGEGDDLILLPFRDDVRSDDEFAHLDITSDDREIAVVLDTSGSMDGSPLEATKNASRGFIHKILQEYADIGIITFNSGANAVADFSMNEAYLQQSLENIYAGGGTETGSGLSLAYEMLQNSGARQKIIVLMSDGESQDDPLPIAQEIKDSGITIYTLGFFSEIGNKAYVQSIMEGVASEGCHYEVDSTQVLQGFFDDIASQINGQKYYYIRMACPVDVSVKYNGEKLESQGAIESRRTSFGTLTFEENTQEDESFEDNSSDKRIKVLRLKSDADYDIQIFGNGKGKMEYTIGFMDENGEYSDMRKFKSIPITRKTEINTVAAETATTTLEVDTDGDGKVDVKYRAGKNGRGEIVDISKIAVIIICCIAVVLIFIIIMVLIRKHRKNVKGRA